MEIATALFAPFIGSMLILLFGRYPNIRDGISVITAIVSFLTILAISENGINSELVLFNIAPGIDFGFRADPLGLVFALTSSSLWILVSIYSIGYMRTLKEHAQTRFFFCFAMSIFSAFGIAFSKNLITFYVFYELLTIFTYPLVAHEESDEARSAGRRYLAYLIPSGASLLAATLITYWLTGTTDFRPGGFIFGDPEIVKLVFILFLLGSAKSAFMPLHSWLPTAMVAPAPVSALLHAVAVVKAGVFGVIRIVYYVYGVDLMKELNLGLLLGGIAAFTVIMANILAIGETNLKRRIAYSTMNQLSFIILAASLLHPYGFLASVMHIPFHGFMKITLFLCAGAVAAISGKHEVFQLDGLGKSLRFTFGAFTVGAIGMSGLPPVAGFISKWFVVLTGNVWVIAIILTASILDVAYLFPIVRNAFFRSSEERYDEMGSYLNAYMVVPLSLTALFSIILFLMPGLMHISDLASMALREVWGNELP